MSKTKNTNKALEDSAPFDTFEDSTSFVPNFDDVYDEVVLPVGTEAQIQIVSVDTGTDKNGGTYWRLRCEILDQPTAKDITTFISFPGPSDDAKRVNRKKLSLMRMMQSLKMDLTKPFSQSDLIGLTAWVILGIQSSDEYGDQNIIKRWL